MPIQAPTDPAIAREVIERRRKGELRKVISLEMGLCLDVISKLTAHLPEDVPNGRREQRRVKILALLDEGMSPRQVAEKLGCSVYAASLIANARLAEARAFAPETRATPEDIERFRREKNAAQRRRYAARKARKAAYDFEGPQLPESPGNSDY